MIVTWTMSELQTNEDHEVLESEYCSGYMDGNGKWNTGFYCPSGNAVGALHCCGTSTHKYCCMQKEAFSDESQFDTDLPLVLGIILGITTAVTIVMLASCCFCSCCLLYKKRQGHLNDAGPVYQMHCSSTASGVANMYSFSIQNSISTQSSQSVVQQLSIQEPLQGHESNVEILGSIVDSNHPGLHSSTLQPHTFSGNGYNTNFTGSEFQCRKGIDSEAAPCVDPSLSNINVQPELPDVSGNSIVNASHFTIPRLVTVVEEVPKHLSEEQPFLNAFHSYPEKRNDTFFPTMNEDSCAPIIYRGPQLPESSLTTPVGNKMFADSQEITNNTMFDTREPPTDENLYRSTKF